MVAADPDRRIPSFHPAVIPPGARRLKKGPAPAAGPGCGRIGRSGHIERSDGRAEEYWFFEFFLSSPGC